MGDPVSWSGLERSYHSVRGHEHGSKVLTAHCIPLPCATPPPRGLPCGRKKEEEQEETPPTQGLNPKGLIAKGIFAKEILSEAVPIPIPVPISTAEAKPRAQ